MGPVENGAEGPGFPFKVGDKVRINDWEPGKHITITGLGRTCFLATAAPKNETGYVMEPYGADTVARFWELFVEQRERTVVVERRAVRLHDHYFGEGLGKTEVIQATMISVNLVRDVIVGVKQ